MTAVLESLSWWPWTPRHIHNVRHDQEAPGLVTLRWHTQRPVTTTLVRPDGTALFHREMQRTRHRVTLTGGAGRSEDVVIRAGESEHTVAVGF